MAIKEQLDQVRSMIVPEQMEQASTILKGIENEVLDITSALNAANSESKGRKLEIRELKDKLTERELDVEQWKKKADTSELTKRLNELSEYKKKNLDRERTSFRSQLNTIKEHPNFEKAKSKFVLPEKLDDEEGWGKIDEQAWEKNISMLGELNDLDYFSAPDKKNLPDHSKGGRVSTDGKKIPTAQEAVEIRAKHGLDSKEYKEALELRKQTW